LPALAGRIKGDNVVVDSHQHVYYHSLSPENLLAEKDEFGIDLTWLLTWYLPPAEHVPSSHSVFNPRNARPDGTHAGATYADVLEMCRRFPDRFVPGYCPCPAEEDAAERFEAAYRFDGVRVCGEWSYRMLLDDPRALRLFRRAGALGCPVVLHMDVPFLPGADGEAIYQTNWYGGDIYNLERALQACPETVFVGHAPGFWRFISGDAAVETANYPQGTITPGGEVLRLLDTYPNLWADLSAGSGLGALQRDLDKAGTFLARYADRLLYGRDAPGNDLQLFLRGLGLEADIEAKIFGGNARRLLALG
jgi:predicted TIM-barrel fold metal-dependent hydrolase